MIEFENSADLQKQIPVITEKKLSQLLLISTCILAAQTTNLSSAARRMSKVLGKFVKKDTAYARLIRFFRTGNTIGILQFVFIDTSQHNNAYFLFAYPRYFFPNFAFRRKKKWQ